MNVYENVKQNSTKDLWEEIKTATRNVNTETVEKSMNESLTKECQRTCTNM